MIHANEIRIGNIYNRKHGKGWTQIVMDEFYMYKIFSPDKDYALNDFEPIEITPEILQACGFIKDRNGWHMPGMQFSLTDKFFPCWLDHMLWPQDIPDFISLSLKHLHQLQNLYRDLTGTELIYKP